MKKEALALLDGESLYEAAWQEFIDIEENPDPIELTDEQFISFALLNLEMEVNNGGLCQFFCNSSGWFAPAVSSALDIIGCAQLKQVFDDFVADNEIDVNDLSSFHIEDLNEYEALAERFDYDRFDDAFYDDPDFHDFLIQYIRDHLGQIFTLPSHLR